MLTYLKLEAHIGHEICLEEGSEFLELHCLTCGEMIGEFSGGAHEAKVSEHMSCELEIIASDMVLTLQCLSCDSELLTRDCRDVLCIERSCEGFLKIHLQQNDVTLYDILNTSALNEEGLTVTTAENFCGLLDNISGDVYMLYGSDPTDFVELLNENKCMYLEPYASIEDYKAEFNYYED